MSDERVRWVSFFINRDGKWELNVPLTQLYTSDDALQAFQSSQRRVAYQPDWLACGLIPVSTADKCKFHFPGI